MSPELFPLLENRLPQNTPTFIYSLLSFISSIFDLEFQFFRVIKEIIDIHFHRYFHFIA